MFAFFTFQATLLVNLLINVKDLVINRVISPTGAPFADINEAIFMLSLITEKTTRFISKNSRTLTYLPICVSRPHFSPIKKTIWRSGEIYFLISLARLILDSELLAPKLFSD